MKFTSTLFGLAAVAIAAASASESSDNLTLRDTHESGLVHLGGRSYERKARHLQQAAGTDDLEKRDSVAKSGRLTYYAGNQLSNPACGGRTPTDEDMVVAVKKNGGYGKCGDWVRIHWKGKMVSAKVVDYCESCKWGHFDGSKGVFRELDKLGVGVLKGIHFNLIEK